jgi:transcriptional regulator with XRE-family HTH domain
MSSPETILQVLRAEMRSAGVTYRTLAGRIGMSESSVKRIFSSGDMSLTRLARICKATGIAMEGVLRQAADAAPRADTLTLAQERALVSDPKLLLVAICCVGQWSLAQIVETYELTEAACVKSLVRLDRLGLIELKPANRYRMKVSRAFRWRPDGPVQHYFRAVVVGDYFGGRFDDPGETLLLVSARVSQPSAIDLVQKIQQLAGELARRHELDQRLDPADRDGYTLVVGLRSWELAAFTAMRRPAAPA